VKPGSTVLLVDDDESDVFLFRRAIKSLGLEYDVHVAHNGQEAVEYLDGLCSQNDPENHPMPKFILTDNRMPVMTGRELLAWIQDHPKCRVIPTVVLGGSASPEDVREAYELGAHSYFVKPMGHQQLQELVQLIFAYWSHAKIPQHSGAKDA
jgi:CheY-like chemotaxis protein